MKVKKATEYKEVESLSKSHQQTENFKKADHMIKSE